MASRNRKPGQRSDRESVVTDAGLTTAIDAIELLKKDHRQVEEWFAQFAATDDPARKEDLAGDICRALEVHAQLEEELFYPAFLDAGGDAGLHDAALDDHAAARALIAGIRHSAGAARDDSFDAQVKELAAMIRRHVAEEERPGGMFAQAEAIGMDLELLGPKLEQRKVQLMDDARTDAGYDAAVGVPGSMQSVSPGMADPDLRGGVARR